MMLQTKLPLFMYVMQVSIKEIIYFGLQCSFCYLQHHERYTVSKFVFAVAACGEYAMQSVMWTALHMWLLRVCM